VGFIQPRSKTFVLILIFAIAAAAAVLLWMRPRDVSTADLLDHFPAGDGIIAWADVAALRSAGVLDLIAGSKTVQEPDYISFVQQSGFDYARDLDGVLLTVRGDDIYLLLTGRFRWNQLEKYVTENGGSCGGSICRIAGSRVNRNISFSSIRNGVMALAVGPGNSAVSALLTRKNQSRSVPSSQPVWISLPPSALQGNASALLPGTRPFTSALSKADSVTLSIGPREDRLEAFLEVTCPTPGDAAFLQLQMQEATELLKNLIARENKQPNPNDLSGVLTAGTFGRNDRQVWGKWPIERHFVRALADGAF
jgi:hypothetical protein